MTLCLRKMAQKRRKTKENGAFIFVNQNFETFFQKPIDKRKSLWYNIARWEKYTYATNPREGMQTSPHKGKKCFERNFYYVHIHG